MKKLLLVSTLFTASIISPPAFPQGSLTPPGPPAATMQTLDQLGTKADQANAKLDSANGGVTTANAKLDTLGNKAEARTAISSAPFTIPASGSYYLTKNLNVTTGEAIIIAASSVTLDLNGFTISSTAASATGTAILINSALRNIAIHNGSIQSGVTQTSGAYSGSGFANGIYFSGTAPVNVRVREVSVAGVLSNGIYVNEFNSSVIEACVVNTAGGIGIFADSVSNSTALNCGNYGVFATTATNCYGTGSGSGNGVSAYTATNCYGIGLFAGVSASSGTNCSGQSLGSGYGVIASIATNCYGISGSGGHGVRFSLIGNMCYGLTNGVGSSYVLGNGLAGPVNLP